MDEKHIARYLGALSIEERVQILLSLLEAGSDGLQMLDIAANTELGVAAVSKQIEALTGLELVVIRSIDNNKMYIANLELIDNLFEWMYQQFGPGFKIPGHVPHPSAGDAVTTQAQS
jgi:DNA-binding transcriptional ArsR family regulator